MVVSTVPGTSLEPVPETSSEPGTSMVISTLPDTSSESVQDTSLKPVPETSSEPGTSMVVSTVPETLFVSDVLMVIPLRCLLKLKSGLT